MHVAFWAASSDGSSMFRCDDPANALTWLGHTTWSSQLLPATQKAKADVIVGARVAQKGALDAWRDLRDRGKRLVLDLDDDYLHVDETNNPKAYAFWSAPDVRARLLDAVALSDRVTVVSDALAEVMREHHGDVRVVPNGLHAWMLSDVRDYSGPDVRVGWVGTGSTAPGLALVARALNRIVDYRPATGGTVTVSTLGVGPDQVRDSGLPPTRDRVEVVEWAPPGRPYLRHVARCDVLVAPYPDTPFNRAKAPTKALEAGFLGVPLVASDIRPYREAITHGVNGFLVREPHEWGKYLKMLVDDPYLREQMGDAARSSASRYTLQNTVLQWEGAITW